MENIINIRTYKTFFFILLLLFFSSGILIAPSIAHDLHPYFLFDCDQAGAPLPLVEIDPGGTVSIDLSGNLIAKVGGSTSYLSSDQSASPRYLWLLVLKPKDAFMTIDLASSYLKPNIEGEEQKK